MMERIHRGGTKYNFNFFYMNKEIISYTDLEAMGLKPAKLVANRQIKRAIQAAKKRSLRKSGQAIPAIIVDAKAVVDQGFGILDFKTGAPIPAEEVENYVVIVDGAHRFDAHLNLLKEAKEGEYSDDFYFMFPLNEKQTLNIGQLLAEINTCTTPWKGGDYAIGASMMVNEDLPVLSFITELAKKGCSLRAACELATLTDSITKGVIVKAMKGEIEGCLRFAENLEYGKKIYALAAEKFGGIFLKTRTFPDWLLKIINATPSTTPRIITIESVISFLERLSDEDAAEIVKMKGSSGGETKESLVNKRLDELFLAFQNKSE